MIRPALIAIAIALPGPALAGQATVLDAQAIRDGDTWDFDVTVSHADEGWDHYADAWELRTLTGGVLARRELLHPHESERSFTSALTGVGIPPGTREIEIWVRDTLHGWGPPFRFILRQ